MIVEQRDYHVHTGKLPDVLRLYEEVGIPLQQEILGGLVGAFTTEIGALSTYSTLWRYDSFAEREERRTRLQADPRWKEFLAKVQPLFTRSRTGSSFRPRFRRFGEFATDRHKGPRSAAATRTDGLQLIVTREL